MCASIENWKMKFSAVWNKRNFNTNWHKQKGSTPNNIETANETLAKITYIAVDINTITVSNN